MVKARKISPKGKTVKTTPSIPWGLLSLKQMEERFQKALKFLLKERKKTNKGIKKNKIAQMFNIPQTTFYRQVRLQDSGKREKYSDKLNKRGPKPILGEVEKILVQELRTRARHGVSLGNREVKSKVVSYLKEDKHTMGKYKKWTGKDRFSGDKWLRSFKNRHKDELFFGKEKLKVEKDRAKAANPVKINVFFDALEKIYEKHEFNGYMNTDEGGLMINPPDNRRRKRYFGKNGSRKGSNNQKHSETVTVTTTFTSWGCSLPTSIIYPRKRLDGNWMSKKIPKDKILYGARKSHIMDERLFIDQAKVIISHVPEAMLPCLWTFDGHHSHISAKVIEYALSKNIYILVLASKLSWMIQDNDKLFHSLKNNYGDVRSELLVKTGQEKVVLEDVDELVYEACLRTYTPISIQNAIKDACIWPSNREGALKLAGDLYKPYVDEIPEMKFTKEEKIETMKNVLNPRVTKGNGERRKTPKRFKFGGFLSRAYAKELRDMDDNEDEESKFMKKYFKVKKKRKRPKGYVPRRRRSKRIKKMEKKAMKKVCKVRTMELKFQKEMEIMKYDSEEDNFEPSNSVQPLVFFNKKL